MNYIVVTIDEGKVSWISTCRTMRGAQASARNSRKYSYRGKNQEIRILSVADILAWDDGGLRELEAMYSLPS